MTSWSHRIRKKRFYIISLLITVAVVALVVRLAPDLHTDWEDLIAIGKLDSCSGDRGIRRWVAVPGRPPFVITLRKHTGGMHNRVWQLSVGVSSNHAIEADQKLAWTFGEAHRSDDPESLASICTLQSVDGFAEFLTAPSFWYRVTPEGPEILVRQAASAWNRDFEFKDGYYIWTPGNAWRSSDRWGTKGPPARYGRAKSDMDPPDNPRRTLRKGSATSRK